MPKVDKTCKLCHADNITDGFQISNSEGKRLQIATIIHNHFPLIFSEPPKSGWVCNDCWSKLQAFHEFYLIVETVHDSMLDPEFIKEEIEEPILCKQEMIIEDVVIEATDADNLPEESNILEFFKDGKHRIYSLKFPQKTKNNSR